MPWDQYTVGRWDVNYGEQQFLAAFPRFLVSFISRYYSNKSIVVEILQVKLLNYYLTGLALRNIPIMLFEDSVLDIVYQKDTKLVVKRLPLIGEGLRVEILKLKDLKTSKYQLFGEITPYSSNYRFIYDNLKNVEMGTYPMNATQYFSELPEHRYLGAWL